MTDGVTVQRCNIGGFHYYPTDYGAEIFITGYPGSGLNHVNILNNTLHGLVGPTSPDDNGIAGYGNGKNIHNVVYQGNTVYDIGASAGGGFPGSLGNGILANGVDGGVLQNNVVHDLGANVTTCGGPGGVWAYNSNNITIQFNEAYDIQPVPYVSGCDWTGYDLDGGVTNSTVQYNYSHDNYGPGYLLFAGSAWGPNTVRYNISENDDRRGTDSSNGSIHFYGSGASPAVINVYNNTVWNENPGPANVRPTAIALQGSLPTAGIIANNIFAVTKNQFGQAYFTTDNGLGQTTVQYKNNSYFMINGGTPTFRNGSIVTSFATWQAAVPGGDTNATSSDPLLSDGGNGGTCGGYSTVCPSAYTLQNSSLLAGTGVDLTQNPFSLSVGSQDYFGNTIPNGGTGTGFNVGAY